MAMVHLITIPLCDIRMNALTKHSITVYNMQCRKVVVQKYKNTVAKLKLSGI